MLKLIYPMLENPGDPRADYPLRLLRLALERSRVPYTLEERRCWLSQDEALHELNAGGAGCVNIVWTMTSVQRELHFRPVRIPIYKGLIGWRLPFVDAGHPGRLASVSSLRQLTHYLCVQGDDWPDTQILRANGMSVCTLHGTPDMFSALTNHDADYFPRSIVEIWGEAQARPSVSICPNLLLHYPSASYFFLKTGDVETATIVENCLENIVKNGLFEALFRDTFGDPLQRADLANRQRIELTNPLLPAETPIHRTELWFG